MPVAAISRLTPSAAILLPLLLVVAAGDSTAQTLRPPDAAPATGHARLPCAQPVELISAGLNDPLQDLARTAELWDAASLRSRTARRPSNELRLLACPGAPAHGPAALRPREAAPFQAGPSVIMLPAGMTSQINTGYPRGGNAGLRWAGRGLSTDFRTGVVATWGPITAVLAPVAAYHQNSDFETVEVRRPGHSEFANPWHTGIDMPQRFGAESFTTVHLGQSVLRLDLRGFATGFSTENLWWGPAIRNPVIMSNNAPGVPHFFIGTARPHDVWIGNLELDAVWGRLATSDYHRLDPPDESVLFSGIVLTLEPRGAPGLYLGLARSYLENFRPGDFAIWEQLGRPYTRMTENIRNGSRFGNNQLASLFARWVLPESGFEVYVEWAREDHWDSTIHLMNEPEHSRGYTAGFQKAFPVRDSGRSLRVQGEVTYLGLTSSERFAQFTFYAHSRILQGYTQRGQVMGAWIGPGSDAQFLGFDLLDPRGRVGVYVERIRYDADAYKDRFAQWYDFRRHDVELTGGIRAAWAHRQFTLASELGFGRRYNRNFLRLDGISWDREIDTNWGLQLDLSWRPDLGAGRAPASAIDHP